MDSGMLARRSVLKQGMAMIAIVLLCAPGDDAMGGGPAHGPSWREVAARSQSFGPQDITDAAERIEHLPPKVSAEARNLLAQMASVSLDAAGLRKALELLDRELPGYFKYSPAERPGQDHPHGTAVRRAALLLVHGLLVGAGARAQSHNSPESATAGMIRALRACKSFREIERTRLEEELMLAVTSKVFFAAEKLLEHPAEPPK